MVTQNNIAQHELIGLNVRVISSPDPTHAGTNGNIVDETRNMLVIRKTGGKDVKIQKSGAVFEFDTNGRNIRIDGNDIEFRPEDRIKKCRRNNK